MAKKKRHALLTDEITKKIPLVPVDREDPLVICKFFFPVRRLTWYVTNGRPLGKKDFIFYGYVQGLADEWKHFRLTELESYHKGSFHVERDVNFRPRPISECIGKRV